jgi:hypothetical protein
MPASGVSQAATAPLRVPRRVIQDIVVVILSFSTILSARRTRRDRDLLDIWRISARHPG